MKTRTDGNRSGKRLPRTSIANHIFFLLPAFLLTLTPGPALADPSDGQIDGWHMMGWGYGNNFGYMHGLFGFFWMILLLGGLIALVIFAVRGVKITHTDGRASNSDKTPLDILKERYARGEIDSEEFEERKQRLSQ